VVFTGQGMGVVGSFLMASSAIAAMRLPAVQSYIFIVLFSIGMGMLMYARIIHGVRLVSRPSYLIDVACFGPPQE
jgi:hypothetical protein